MGVRPEVPCFAGAKRLERSDTADWDKADRVGFLKEVLGPYTRKIWFDARSHVGRAAHASLKTPLHGTPYGGDVLGGG
jgi:hypothetical protein